MISDVILIGTPCIFVGVFIGWILFRSERVYQQGWHACERFTQDEARRKALRNTSHLINPETQDWYDK